MFETIVKNFDTLKAPQTIKIEMTRGLEDGVSYTSPGDQEITGPYSTGCAAEGAVCFEVPMTQAGADAAGLPLISVAMRGAGKVGHWKAETFLDELYVDGDEVSSWTDSGENENDLTLFDDSSLDLILRENVLNGYPTVCGAYEYDPEGGYGTTLLGTGEIDVALTQDITVYAVVKFHKEAWLALFGLLDAANAGEWWSTSWEPAVCSWGVQYEEDSDSSQVCPASRNGWNQYFWREDYVAAERDDISDDWHIIAIRYPNVVDSSKILIDGAEYAKAYDRTGDRGATATAIEFQALNLRQFSPGYDCDAWQCAEIIAYTGAHTDAAMLSMCQELATKYGLELG